MENHLGPNIEPSEICDWDAVKKNSHILNTMMAWSGWSNPGNKINENTVLEFIYLVLF